MGYTRKALEKGFSEMYGLGGVLEPHYGWYGLPRTALEGAGGGLRCMRYVSHPPPCMAQRGAC